MYKAANISASNFLDNLATNNPRFVVTEELKKTYSLTKYNDQFAVVVLNRGDLIVEGIRVFGNNASDSLENGKNAPNIFVATIESAGSSVKGASPGDLTIPAGSKIEGLSSTKVAERGDDDSGMIILAGRDLVFGRSANATGQIGTAPIKANALYQQTILTDTLNARFYDGGAGVDKIVSTEFLVGVPTKVNTPDIKTHLQQRVALDFGSEILKTKEQGFDVIVSYFDGKTQRFANATQQGTTYQLPSAVPKTLTPLNPLTLPKDPLESIPFTNISVGLSDEQFRNNVVFQRTDPLTVNRFEIFRMLTPANTLATNSIVRRSSDFFLFENVNSALTDPSAIRDITFASQYIDNVKPYAEAFSMMDANPQMLMPQIWNGEMMESIDQLPLIRQDKSDPELKAAQRTVEVAVYDVGYEDVDKSTNASQDDKPNESQIGNAVGDQEPLLKVITYRIKKRI